MAFWQFSDGTVLHSYGIVEGNKPFADHLRQELIGLGFGFGPLVWTEPPTKAVSLDTSNDELLWRWALQEAQKAGLEMVRSDFQAAETGVSYEGLNPHQLQATH